MLNNEEKGALINKRCLTQVYKKASKLLNPRFDRAFDSVNDGLGEIPPFAATLSKLYSWKIIIQCNSRAL